MPAPLRVSDLSTIDEQTERSTEAGSSIARTSSFPSAISQITDASEGYEIPVGAQLATPSNTASTLLGRLPLHLTAAEDDEDEDEYEESYYAAPAGAPPPPQLSRCNSLGTRPDTGEGSSSFLGGGLATSSPSISQWLEEGHARQGSSNTVPTKRKWMWRSMIVIISMIVLIIVGVAIGIAVGSGVSSKSSSSATANRDDGGGTLPLGLTQSPTLSPTAEPPNVPVHNRPPLPTDIPPMFPDVDSDPSTSWRTVAPTQAPAGTTKPPPPEETLENEPNLNQCPQLPGTKPSQSDSDGSRIARYRVVWGERVQFGVCESAALGMTAWCNDPQSVAAVFSDSNDCTAIGNQIQCTDTTSTWIELGCVGKTMDNDLGMRVQVDGGRRECFDDQSEFFTMVSAACGSYGTFPFTCPYVDTVIVDDFGIPPVPICYLGYGCDPGLPNSCLISFTGALLEIDGSSCAEEFSLSRRTGEDCEVDMECASNICALGICRERKGCVGDDCERDEHCQYDWCNPQSNQCDTP